LYEIKGCGFSLLPAYKGFCSAPSINTTIGLRVYRIPRVLQFRIIILSAYGSASQLSIFQINRH